METELPELALLLKTLENPQLKTIDLSLNRMIAALEAVGNPHLRLPPVIHIAGTNGKGSTLSFIRAMAEAAGYTVHAYTSPHLVHVRERFYVSGAYMKEDDLIQRLESIKALNERYPLTFFEATTLCAFQLFAENPADLVLLETGLGGQFDATNVVPEPAVSVITPIGLDHQAFLGNTIAKIAYEKACIIKSLRPCIIGKQSAEAHNVIKKKAEALNATLYRFDEEFTLAKMHNGTVNKPVDKLSIACEKYGDMVLPLPIMQGEHQYENATVAAIAAHVVSEDSGNNVSIVEEHIAQGIKNAFWPARLQPIRSGELRAIIPPTMPLFLDGGHNAHAAEAIAAWAAAHNYTLNLICAMVQGRDPQDFLRPLTHHIHQLCAVAIEGEPLSQSPEMLYGAAQKLGIDSGVYASETAAAQHIAAAEPRENSVTLLCGSLYFAGAILKNHS